MGDGPPRPALSEAEGMNKNNLRQSASHQRQLRSIFLGEQSCQQKPYYQCPGQSGSR